MCATANLTVMNSKRAVREIRASYVQVTCKLRAASESLGVLSGSDNFIKYYWLLKRLRPWASRLFRKRVRKGQKWGIVAR